MVLVIAGDRSGVGKTTVTLALLSALCRRGKQVQSFKVGPDYIDPMFHQYVTGRACRNLDPVLTSEAYVKACFDRHAQTADCALVEGVMGLFDGVSGTDNWASTAHVARLLDAPVLLVLDCSHVSQSIAAVVSGYRSFDPRLKLAGVVLNRVGSDRHLQLLEGALQPLQIPILGVLRRQDAIHLPDRHLGLVPTGELANLGRIIDRLARLGETCFEWEQLLPFIDREMSAGTGLDSPFIHQQPTPKRRPDRVPTENMRVAIARDLAFNFYYTDNLDALVDLGVELVPWSPLSDTALPENIHGLYFGGGFPEMFAQQLAANHSVLRSVKHAIQSGIPTYAECGGLMYLSEALLDFEGRSFNMVGILPTAAVMGKRLTLGYRQATVLRDTPLLATGMTVWGHEFHRSHLTNPPSIPLFQTRGYYQPDRVQTEGWHLPQLHASYLHLHWGAHPEIPQRFVKHLTRRPSMSN
jgi:cobyrinic acid a,c-diamide synthase